MVPWGKSYRRTVDGYVNATAMCKANGKEWSNYYKSERTSQYLQALQGSLPNGSDLVQVIGTGQKANGKKWIDYYRQERTVQYLRALEGSTGFPADLVTTITNGPNERRSKYAHPRLAADLARWINPEFAVWMDGS